MTTDARGRLTVSQRRQARKLACWNGGIWALGNGLVSGTLVIYLALELGAPKIALGIGLILAAPQIAGLLRLGAPALIGRLADRKRFCLGAYLLSALVLFGLPFATAPGGLPSAAASLGALVALWCIYHLLEYLGSVALWSWLSDLVPQRIRGGFLGRRERWMVSGQAIAMLAAGLFNYWWQQRYSSQRTVWWIGYAISAETGVWFLVGALVPLAKMPGLAAGRAIRGRAALAAMVAPLSDPRFLRLLCFGCWFSFFNGVILSAQSIYPVQVLKMSLLVMLVLPTGMRCGQLALSPWLGRLADRAGNRPVMMASLSLVAAGPLFYFFSSPRQPWWLIGAWVLWIAYAGLNVCLPNLMLKLSPQKSNTPYIAAYYAVTGLCLAASTIAGGAVFDYLGDQRFVLFAGALSLDYYHYAFLFGWFTRSLGVVMLLLVIEPRTQKFPGS